MLNTTSQIISFISTLATICSGLVLALRPFQDQLPQIAQTITFWIGITGVIAGVIITAGNQSLSPNHISVPVEEAIRRGLVRPLDGDYPLDESTSSFTPNKKGD